MSIVEVYKKIFSKSGDVHPHAIKALTGFTFYVIMKQKFLLLGNEGV